MDIIQRERGVPLCGSLSFFVEMKTNRNGNDWRSCRSGSLFLHQVCFVVTAALFSSAAAASQDWTASPEVTEVTARPPKPVIRTLALACLHKSFDVLPRPALRWRPVMLAQLTWLVLVTGLPFLLDFKLSLFNFLNEIMLTEKPRSDLEISASGINEPGVKSWGKQNIPNKAL